MKIILLNIILILSSFCVFSQQKTDSLFKSLEFYRYLEKEKLYNEQLEWLYNSQITDTSLDKNLALATCFHSMHKTDSLFTYLYNKGFGNLSLSDKNKFKYSCFVLKDSVLFPDKIFPFFTKTDSLSYTMLTFGKSEIIVKDEKEYPLEFLALVNHYNSFKPRSTFGACLLSTAVPGAGKLYLGKKDQAISAFIFSAILGALTIESLKHGVKSYQFVASAGSFSLFYIGNIWGTASLSKKISIDHKKQVHENISQYYSDILY